MRSGLSFYIMAQNKQKKKQFLSCRMLTVHSLIMKRGFYFPTGISYIPFIHNVKKWGKFDTAIV